MNGSPENAIDFVLLWVDGADPVWQKKKNEYQKKENRAGYDASAKRYRDYGLLKYWFRGVEKYAPWVHKVFLITDEQTPDWLNRDCPKLVCVDHKDYIPREDLPTFSANPIELNLHRIDELGERFVFFNDDMFLTRSVSPDFFFKSGLPVLNPQISLTTPGSYSAFAHITLNNTMLINQRFNARKTILKAPGKWILPWKVGTKSAVKNLLPLVTGRFTGFSNPHLASPFLKSTLFEVWEQYPEYLAKTSHNRFRSYEDVSQYLFFEWQLATGKFVPQKRKKLGRYFESAEDGEMIAASIRRQEYPMVCINDVDDDASDESFMNTCRSLKEAFESILGEKSAFEKA